MKNCDNKTKIGESKAFKKRVKRRITAREHIFFSICSPGLKKVCKNEMLALGFSDDSLKVMEGGIEFKGKLNECFASNLYLRSASRILMRINCFKADSFKKLEKKINDIDWTLYLPGNCSLAFNVTAKKSRLYHSDAIAQRCEKIIADQLKSLDAFSSSKKASIQTVYIRAENDNFTISLDSTGDLLFKRGIKQKINQAPLRENIAFSMLHWAGFSREDLLIDPMCGSGTFSIEAAMMKTNLPPGIYRSFAFEAWPGSSEKTYSHMKKQAKEQFCSCEEKQIFASDMDDTALSAIKDNIKNHDFKSIIDISKKDFFSLTPSKILSGTSQGKKGFIMLNPPYGKRLGQKSNTNRLYNEIGKKLLSDFRGWKAGIILPSRECKSYLGLRVDLKPIFHGGLDIFAGIAKL